MLLQIVEEGLVEEGCKFVEDVLYQGRSDLYTVLRMMCLLSLTNNGLPRRTCDQLRRMLLLNFGYENLILLNNLETAKLLHLRPDSKNTFPAIRKAFSLVYEIQEDGSSNMDPVDIGNYTCSL